MPDTALASWRRHGGQVRFDDSLKTVLAADTSSAFGAGSAFRQIVDLIARRRADPAPEILEKLKDLRRRVPTPVRAASARALALVDPPAALVGFFASDEIQVALPVLRAARLDDAEWTAILPVLGPAGRAVLRDRGDLSTPVAVALESFGPVDLTIGFSGTPAAPAPAPAPALQVREVPRLVDQPPAPPVGEGSFVALGTVAREIPLVAEALRRAAPEPVMPETERFEIADLVERIETFQRDRERVAVEPAARATTFRFGTDIDGVVTWVEGVERGAIVGASALAGRAPDDPLLAAYRGRVACRDATFSVAGDGESAGLWRISVTPAFDPRSGRFLGMRGAARRAAVVPEAPGDPVADRSGAEALRRLAHELRTPTNAIAGFAELIETEMLGSVAPVHRDRAAGIRQLAGDLTDAIEDVDTAARIDSAALDLRADQLPVAAMLAETIAQLAEAAQVRGVTIDLSCPPDLVATADRDATRRLIARLLTLRIADAAAGETIAVIAARAGTMVGIELPRARVPDDAAEQHASLLGTDFLCRLVRRLALEIGGDLSITPGRLTLRLPAGLKQGVQVTTH